MKIVEVIILLMSIHFKRKIIIDCLEEYLKRRTNRFRFEDRNIPDILLAGINYIVDKYPHYKKQKREQDKIWLHITEESNEKNALAELVAHGNSYSAVK